MPSSQCKYIQITHVIDILHRALILMFIKPKYITMGRKFYKQIENQRSRSQGKYFPKWLPSQSIPHRTLIHVFIHALNPNIQPWGLNLIITLKVKASIKTSQLKTLCFQCILNRVYILYVYFWALNIIAALGLIMHWLEF